MLGIVEQFNIFLNLLETYKVDANIFHINLLENLNKAASKQEDVELTYADISSVLENCSSAEPELNQLVMEQIHPFCQKALERRNTLCSEVLKFISACHNKEKIDKKAVNSDVLSLLEAVFGFSGFKTLKKVFRTMAVKSAFQVLVASQRFSSYHLIEEAEKYYKIKKEILQLWFKAVEPAAKHKTTPQPVKIPLINTKKARRSFSISSPVDKTPQSAPTPSSEKIKTEMRQAISQPTIPVFKDTPVSSPSSSSSSSFHVDPLTQKEKELQSQRFILPLKKSKESSSRTISSFESRRIITLEDKSESTEEGEQKLAALSLKEKSKANKSKKSSPQ